MIPASFGTKKCPAGMFFSKKHPSGRGPAGEARSYRWLREKGHGCTSARWNPAAASRIWIWSVDLGDDRAQDHVWIPNCPCRFELKEKSEEIWQRSFFAICAYQFVSVAFHDVSASKCWFSMRKGQKTLKLAPQIYESLQKEKVTVDPSVLLIHPGLDASKNKWRNLKPNKKNIPED